MSSYMLSGQRVDIELDSGVYVFVNESGLGKTFLASLLKGKQGEDGFKFFVISYDDVRMLPLETMLSVVGSGYVVLLDRYDMYYSEKHESLIEDIGKRNIVLLDFKQDAFMMSNRYAVIDRKEKEICVRALDVSVSI